MKTIQIILLVSILPIVHLLSAYAENEERDDVIHTLPILNDGEASWRASQVIGINVTNADNEVVGGVVDIIFDIRSGDVLAVMISSGAYLKIPDMLSAVPVTALRHDQAAKQFKTRLTKEQLGKAPQFKTDAWPNYNDATTIKALRAYRELIGGGAIAAGNTGDSKVNPEQADNLQLPMPTNTTNEP